jgi:hypothetical protein
MKILQPYCAIFLILYAFSTQQNYGVFMKKMLILAMISLLSITSFASEAAENKKTDIALGLSFVTTDVAFTIYFPGFVVATSVLATAVGITVEGSNSQLKTLVYNDAQDYHTTGKLSLAMEELTSLVIEQDPNLSESEAVDYVVSLFN